MNISENAFTGAEPGNTSFPIPAPPIIEATDDMRKAVVRLFPSKSIASQVMPFIALALTFRHKTGKEHGVSAWQHGCVDALGKWYLDLLLAHCFLDANPDCTANALHGATREKVSLLLAAEKEFDVFVTGGRKEQARRLRSPGKPQAGRFQTA